jgi:hypothetical protein
VRKSFLICRLLLLLGRQKRVAAGDAFQVPEFGRAVAAGGGEVQSAGRNSTDHRDVEMAAENGDAFPVR